MTNRTPRRAGPTPYLRKPAELKISQGMAVWTRLAAGESVRQAAAAEGLSTTVAWRRAWLVRDWFMPTIWGRPMGPIPPMRSSRACPRGRPFLPTLDGPGGPFHRGEAR